MSKDRITLKDFCKFAKCSKQLVGFYVAKKMPKYQHPNNKRLNMFDLDECFEWALKNNYTSFARKINDAIQTKWHSTLEKEELNELLNELDKEEEMIAPPSPSFDTCVEDDDPDLQHGEGSTAHPVVLRKNKIAEISKHFSAIMKLLEEIYQED